MVNIAILDIISRQSFYEILRSIAPTRMRGIANALSSRRRIPVEFPGVCLRVVFSSRAENWLVVGFASILRSASIFPKKRYVCRAIAWPRDLPPRHTKGEFRSRGGVRFGGGSCWRRGAARGSRPVRAAQRFLAELTPKKNLTRARMRSLGTEIETQSQLQAERNREKIQLNPIRIQPFQPNNQHASIS